MAFSSNGRTGFGNSGGFERAEIPRDRPPLDLVTREGGQRKVLFLDNPCKDVPEIEFRVLAHPEATPDDFLLEVAPGTDPSNGVSTAFAMFPRIAALNINSRTVYLRTDIEPLDSLGNTVSLATTGRGEHRREKYPWDFAVDRLEMMLRVTLGALERGIDIGLPMDWMRFAETTRWNDGRREPMADLMKNAELRRDFKISSDRLLMQGFITLDSACVDAALRRWPHLGQAQMADNGNGTTSFHNLLYSPPTSAVTGLLSKIFGKRDTRKPISIVNSEQGDIYTYEAGCPIRTYQKAKDPKMPLAGLNISYAIGTGMPQPLGDDFKTGFMEWHDAMLPKLTVEASLEQIVKLFEDAATEQAGAGSRFLEEKLTAVRSLFRCLFEDSAYERYLPVRVVQAPDMLPAELKRGYQANYAEGGVDKTGGFWHYLKSLPLKTKLSDKWMKDLSDERRAKSGGQSSRPAALPTTAQVAPPKFGPEMAGWPPQPPKPKFGPAAPQPKSAPPPVETVDWGEIPFGPGKRDDDEAADDVFAAPSPAPAPASATVAKAPQLPARQAPPPMSAVAPVGDMTPGVASGRPPPPPPPKFGRK